jgi:hypothetical protein
MAPKADEVMPMFQPLLRGEPVNGADAVAGDTWFCVSSSIPTSRLVRPNAN